MTSGEEDEVFDIAFEDRMSTPQFVVAPEAHIRVDASLCMECDSQACVGVCPAGLFIPTSDGRIVFNYEQCFECGACYMVCDVEGAIRWAYPVGGAGVVFRRT